jgi:hypothetical protein
LSLELATPHLLDQATTSHNFQEGRVLDKRLDLLLRHRLHGQSDLDEQPRENRLDARQVVLGLGSEEVLKSNVSLGIGLHIGEGAREGEEVGGGGLYEGTNGSQEEPEVGGLQRCMSDSAIDLVKGRTVEETFSQQGSENNATISEGI